MMQDLSPQEGRAPESRERHLRVVGEEVSHRKRGWIVATIVLIAVLATVGTGVGVYRWQHAKVVDQATIASIEQARNATLHGQVTAMTAQATDLRSQISALYKRILVHSQQLEQNAALIQKLQARRDDLAGQLATVQGKLDAAQAELAGAQTMLGSPLPDGVYKGVLLAADDADTPHRIAMYVIDDVNGNVLVDHGWRVLEVSTTAVVRLTTPPLGPSTMSFGAFVELWNNGFSEASYLHARVFQITISGGHVSRLTQTAEPTWGG
jgi:cell division protein FtsB